MGYFNNGCEGMDYEEQYCRHCQHDNEDKGCPVLQAHMLYNYEECNKPGSILHIHIPRSPDKLSNEQCAMFISAHQEAANE